ncbi:thiamine phosphate synthase [Pasteurella atlantica]|uniref:Thiamine phosphate synthase n=2 Tax=Pasteurellaceae TaxID=712 RepID=A0ACC6HKT4_9PAST|nr:thiamine phosphate synthase [Pasteurella atlantica]MDP8051475.1 thiamine phosphate synthase [Pasteurella atlantica]MDP8104645.1 thiamine phosphate synthase [Pasteurella atlantica]MDP8148133.1 thiamine phosphate synthase [Pasteurella atlantica]
MKFNTDILQVYFVAGTQDCRHLEGNPTGNLITILEDALKAGITCFQLREKGKYSLQDREEIKSFAIKCRDLCRAYQIPFIMNNDVDLAIEIGADGVHVGQKDEPIKSVIKRFSHLGFIGLSCNSLEIAQSVNDLDGLSYLGVGPIYETFTKKDVGSAKGTQFLDQLKETGITKPLVAIAGINEQNVADVLLKKTDGIAIVSSMISSTDRKKTVCALKGK